MGQYERLYCPIFLKYRVMSLNFNIDPLGAGLGFIGGLSSMIGGNRNLKKQLEFQKRENEANRNYNLMLAKLQNQWNIEQWNRENAYNDPSAQMSRMRNAKLNPDLMYQNGASGLTAAASPAMTSGAPAQPVDYSAYSNMKTVGDAISDTLSMAQASATLVKTEAEKDNVIEDTYIKKSDVLMKEIDARYHERKVSAELENYRDTNRNLRAQFDKLDAETRILDVEGFIKNSLRDDTIQNIKNEYSLKDNELKFYIEHFVEQINSHNAKLTYEASIAQEEYDYMRRWHEQDMKLDDLIASISNQTGWGKIGSALLTFLSQWLLKGNHK